MSLLAAGLMLGACGQAAAPTAAPIASPAPGRPSALPPTPVPSAVPTATATPEPLAARVNGRPILLAAAQAEAARCAAAQVFTDCPERAQQALIEQAVIEQAAEAAGLTATRAEAEAEADRLRAGLGSPEAYQAWLAAAGYTETDFVEALRRERLRARWAEQVMSAVGDTAEQVRALALLVADEATAQDLAARLAGGADFATLALDYSLDLSSRAAGGDLGWFPRGWLTTPEVEQTAFAQESGVTSAVIASPLGFHLVRTLERDPARPLSPAIRQALRERAFQTWLDAALAQATIERLAIP